MKYLKKISLNENEFKKDYQTYLNRESLYNEINDLMPDIPLLNDYNHGWVQNKKDNTGYFYFLSFKNPMYSSIKDVFKSDLYRMNQMMSDRFNISYTLTYRSEWWMSKDVKWSTKTFDNFSLIHSFLSTLNNNDVISELLIIFDNLELKENIDSSIEYEKNLHQEVYDIMIDLLDTNYIKRESLKSQKTIGQYCYEIVFQKDIKILDVLDILKSSIYSVSGIMDGRYDISYGVSLVETIHKPFLVRGTMRRETNHYRKSIFHLKELFILLEKNKDLFIESLDIKMRYADWY